MKARIKKTGEIVDIISYNDISTKNVSKYLVTYSGLQGIERGKEGTDYHLDFEPIDNLTHWQDVRERAAIAAMGQLIGMGRDDGYKYSPSEVASYAVVYADELIERLKKE